MRFGRTSQLIKKVTGILNGIDDAIFDPKTDEALWCNYSSDTIEKKYENKKMLLKERGLRFKIKASL